MLVKIGRGRGQLGSGRLESGTILLWNMDVRMRTAQRWCYSFGCNRGLRAWRSVRHPFGLKCPRAVIAIETIKQERGWMLRRRDQTVGSIGGGPRDASDTKSNDGKTV